MKTTEEIQSVNDIDDTISPSRKFDLWMYALKWYAVRFFKFKESVIFSAEHWKAYYDEGLKPKQALEEDLNNQNP